MYEYILCAYICIHDVVLCIVLRCVVLRNNLYYKAYMLQMRYYDGVNESPLHYHIMQALLYVCNE